MNPSTTTRRRGLWALAVLLTMALLASACAGAEDDTADAGAAADDPADAAADTATDEADAVADEVSEADAGAADDAASGEAFYDGKQIEILVAHGPGGGTDIQGRFLAPWLTETLPGTPPATVVNVDGGGTILGANEYALQREPDGTNLWYQSATTTFAFLLDDPAVQFDFADYHPVMGVPTGAVFIGTPEVQDLGNLDQPIIYSENSPSGLAVVFLVALELLDVEHEVIFGYEGGGDRLIALESGEVNASWATLSAYREQVEPLIADGAVVPLFSVGQLEDGEVVRDPAFPDIPTVKEVYEEIHGEEPSGEIWEVYKAVLNSGFSLQKILWVHGDAPQEAIDALEAAAEDLASNPEFQAEAEEILEYEVLTGDRLDRGIEDMLAVEQSTIDWLITFLTENYDYEQ